MTLKKIDWRVKITQAIFKKWNWLKLLVLLIALGIILTGFTIQSKWFSCQKEPVKIRGEK